MPSKDDITLLLGWLDDVARGALHELMRVVWSMTLPEIARRPAGLMPTVERDWRFAKAWLAEEINPSGP